MALLLLLRAPRGSKDSAGVESLALLDLPKSPLNERAGADAGSDDDDDEYEDDDMDTDRASAAVVRAVYI